MRYHLALAAALAIQASAARADSIVALIGEDILATIDSRTVRTTNLVKIDGVGPILGIDVRPADGRLYALATDGSIAIIDPLTGKAAAKSKLDRLPLADVQVAVDFNPVADKLRIIGADGTNLRADVDSGKVTEDQPLKFAATDSAAGRPPIIVAGAYSNSIKGAKETTLYDIDASVGALFRQAPPNDGVLNTIGMLGVTVDRIGFDIVTDGAGANTGMLVANGKLYVVDLTTGSAAAGKSIAGLPSDVRDIAVLQSSGAKQAANMMIDNAGAGMGGPSGLPSSVSRSMPDPAKTQMDAAKRLSSRGAYMQQDAASTPKMRMMRRAQCNEGRVQ
jgi:uncharacterized protein DUF4394